MQQIVTWNVGDDIACEKAPFLMDKRTKPRKRSHVIDLKIHIWRSLDILCWTLSNMNIDGKVVYPGKSTEL